MSQSESWREKLILGDFHDDVIWRILAFLKKAQERWSWGAIMGRER